MIIDCFATDKFAIKELAERTGEEIVALSDLIKDDKTEVFSERPFVLAMDYAFSFDWTIVSRFLSMKFGGSKILYCVFIGNCPIEKGRDLSKKIAANKNFVLFGVDNIDHMKLTKEEYFAKIDMLGDSVRNCVPFESAYGADFPCGAKKAYF